MKPLSIALTIITVLAVILVPHPGHAQPLTPSGTAIFGLLGTLQPMPENRYETQLVTAAGTVYRVVGASPAIEERMQRIRAQPQALVKVWGTLATDPSQDQGGQIVVRDLLVLDPPMETIAQEPVQVAVTAGVANVRARPSTDAAVLARVRSGHTLLIIGRDSDDRWWRVCCVQGQIGWIAQRMVEAPGAIAFFPAVQRAEPDLLSTPIAEATAEPATTPMPTAVAVPAVAVPADAALPTDDWRASFYDNVALEGDPVLTTAVDAVAFDWGQASPAPELPVDAFSARFEKILSLPEGFYRFVVQADDGVRVWIGDDLVVDEWHMAAPPEYRFGRMLEGPTPMRIEYYEEGGQAALRFDYELLSEFPDWQASYFDTIDLAGGPDWIEAEPLTDPALSHTWSLDAPVPDVIPEDNFSARWEGTYFFEGGDYRFTGQADDGFRLFLDDILVLDAWETGGPVEEIFQDVGPGDHVVTVEYYERGGIASIQADWERLSP